MKIFENIKTDREKIYKLFGFTIIKETLDYATAEKHQSFCGGFVTMVKHKNVIANQHKKDIKVFGKSVLKRLDEGDFQTYYFLNKPIKKFSAVKEFKHKYFKYFDKKYDDIYILQADSGEIYLLLTYLINELIKRNQSKAPLLVATKKYHVDMIEMLCPNIPYIYIKKMRFKIVDDVFKIDNFRFFYLFSRAHFMSARMGIKQNEAGKNHYFDAILNRLNISKADLTMNKIIVPDHIEESMRKKIEKTGLNLEKFVFIAPEAISCKLYDEDFWCELINQFQAKGYDVFANIVSNEMKLYSATNYKSTWLTYGEAFALAKYAKKIVSLRSGFTEFLLQTNVPTYVLYTKFRYGYSFNALNASLVLSGFSLIKLPYINKEKIKEFNMFETSPKDCLDEILENNI